MGMQIFVAHQLHDALIRIPRDDRTVEPYFAWLTLIPLAGLVFYWILFPFKLPQSLRNYFQRNPSATNGLPADYGHKYGMWYTLSATLCLVPLVNIVAWVPAIGCLIAYMVQLRQIAKKLPPPSSPGGRTPANRYELIAKLKELLDDGALTQDEYDQEKRKILQ